MICLNDAGMGSGPLSAGLQATAGVDIAPLPAAAVAPPAPAVVAPAIAAPVPAAGELPGFPAARAPAADAPALMLPGPRAPAIPVVLLGPPVPADVRAAVPAPGNPPLPILAPPAPAIAIGLCALPAGLSSPLHAQTKVSVVQTVRFHFAWAQFISMIGQPQTAF